MSAEPKRDLRMISAYSTDREARKCGTDVPHEPTDEFVRQAFANGAGSLWPDGRDPGWLATFDRWLAARDAAAEQAGREDNALHDMCYVSGSKALEAREAAARREALLEAAEELVPEDLRRHGANCDAEMERLTQERDYWRNGMDRHGPCVCDTNPETTSGPEEHCPHHGRNYAEWVERGDMLQAKVARIEALAEAMQTWSSHRGLAVDYASRIRAALAEPERDEEGGR